MFKIRIIRNCRLAVLNEDREEVVRNCVKGEDVFIKELNRIDIDDKLYAPYKQQVIVPERVRERQPEEPVVQQSDNAQEQIQNAIALLNTAVTGATELIKSLNNGNNQVPEKPVENKIILANSNGTEKPEKIDEELFIEEGDEPEKEFTQFDYQSAHDRARKIITGTVNEEDRYLTKQENNIKRLPKFAKQNMGAFKAEGSAMIQKVADPLNNNGANIQVVKSQNGKIDVASSLGFNVKNQ